MARYAIIEGGKVANIIEAGAEFAASIGAVLAAVDAAIGDLYDGTVFTKPPAPPPQIPQQVTRRQAKQALALSGKLASVQPAIDAILDAVERTQMQIYWEDSQVFERNHPKLMAMAQALAMTSADVDNLFVTAATLN